MSRHIKLSKEMWALVDDADYDYLNQYSWYFDTGGYAARGKNVGWSIKAIRMHRLVLNAKLGECVDHVNGDKLDNRKENLRICTNSQNLANRPKNKNNTSGYKGVVWDKRKEKWAARIMVDRKIKSAGYYSTVEDAARAYDVAAKKYFGEFANLNFGLK